MLAELSMTEFPEWALPGPFTGPRRACELAEGEHWPNGEAAAGNPHPRGWGTDPELVADGEGGFHGWMNFPHPTTGKTQIAYFHTKDGVHWTAPRTVLTGPPGAIGVETPAVCRWNGVWIFAATVKERLPDGSRRDRVVFYTSRNRPDDQWVEAPYSIAPSKSWEARFRPNSFGQLTGGCMEPSFAVFPQFLVVAYIAQSYAGNNLPSVGICGLVAGETTLDKLPWPVIRNAGQVDLCAVTGPDGQSGHLVTYQANPGSNGDVWFECRYTENFVAFSEPIELLKKGAPGSGDAYRMVGPCLEDNGRRLWWWGQDVKGGPTTFLYTEAA